MDAVVAVTGPHRAWLGAAWCCLLLAAGCTSSRAARDAAAVVTARELTIRGLDATHEDNWLAAEELFRQAVAASPHDERAHFQYAKALWRRGARDEAIDHMSEAVRFSAGAPELLVELGRMHLAVGELDAARATAEQAIRSDRNYAPAHALVGDALLRQGRLNLAMESFHLALALEPGNPEVGLAVAQIYRTWGEPRRSLSTLRTLQAEDLPTPLAVQLCCLRGSAQRELGRLDDALASLTQATRLAPPSPELLYELAEVQIQAGDLPGARQTLRSTLARHGHHEPSRDLLARLETIPHVARYEEDAKTDNRQNR